MATTKKKKKTDEELINEYIKKQEKKHPEQKNKWIKEKNPTGGWRATYTPPSYLSGPVDTGDTRYIKGSMGPSNENFKSIKKEKEEKRKIGQSAEKEKFPSKSAGESYISEKVFHVPGFKVKGKENVSSGSSLARALQAKQTIPGKKSYGQASVNLPERLSDPIDIGIRRKYYLPQLPEGNKNPVPPPSPPPEKKTAGKIIPILPHPLPLKYKNPSASNEKTTKQMILEAGAKAKPTFEPGPAPEFKKRIPPWAKAIAAGAAGVGLGLLSNKYLGPAGAIATQKGVEAYQKGKISADKLAEQARKAQTEEERFQLDKKYKEAQIDKLMRTKEGDKMKPPTTSDLRAAALIGGKYTKNDDGTWSFELLKNAEDYQIENRKKWSRRSGGKATGLTPDEKAYLKSIESDKNNDITNKIVELKKQNPEMTDDDLYYNAYNEVVPAYEEKIKKIRAKLWRQHGSKLFQLPQSVPGTPSPTPLIPGEIPRYNFPRPDYLSNTPTPQVTRTVKANPDMVIAKAKASSWEELRDILLNPHEKEENTKRVEEFKRLGIINDIVEISRQKYIDRQNQLLQAEQFQQRFSRGH